ncbi:c-type cytochrome [Advenella sp. RU8]|uniref:c-type cytochrome n=1 Tax=Advenella sp. RU8 TaxID=3399575 RepID=UPI003AAF34E3
MLGLDMLRSVGKLGLLLMLCMAPAVYASSQEEAVKLARDKVCLGCHQIDKPRVGPHFKAIAERYKDASDEIVTYLAQAIRTGGRGRWGVIPMPAQPQISEEDALTLARWIRSLK